MKPLFHKILCPIDFDRISIPALELARTIATRNDATLFLLYIIPKVKTARLEKDFEQVAHDNLLGVARKWLEGKVAHKIIVRIGTPVAAILKAQEELGTDLTVMATHGRTGKKHARLGSVTEEVVRRSTRPVTTIRPT
jgi:nucleotide-binding universal stress UspA family protein